MSSKKATRPTNLVDPGTEDFNPKQEIKKHLARAPKLRLRRPGQIGKILQSLEGVDFDDLDLNGSSVWITQLDEALEGIVGKDYVDWIESVPEEIQLSVMIEYSLPAYEHMGKALTSLG